VSGYSVDYFRAAERNRRKNDTAPLPQLLVFASAAPAPELFFHGSGSCSFSHISILIRTPKQKIFFRVQSTRLANPFEPLDSSLAQSAEELGCW